MQRMRMEAAAELQKLLHWWAVHLPDDQNGGFYGRVDGHGKLHPTADKGVILNTRILWTFSAAAQRNDESKHWRGLADRAFAYLLRYFWDREEGGVFWMLNYQGEPVQDKKQIYAQAFAIYALAEYYRLTQDREALEKAQELFWLVEQYSRDNQVGGYFEAFSRDWSPLEDMRLSAKDANTAKTMNTHLHVMEGYANLYRVWPEETIGLALKDLTVLLQNIFVNHDTQHLRLFFDEQWNLQSDIISFGHDIEYSWLICDAMESLHLESTLQEAQKTAVAIAGRTLAEGMDDDGGLFNEANTGGLTDHNKDWWPQVEAVVGYINAWQISGEGRFWQAAKASWTFTKEYLTDWENGEWFWALRADGQPDRENDKAGPWKCPYHNGRAFLEVMKRLSLVE